MATPIPENRASFSLAEIASATGGQVRAGRATSVTGVVTDTRATLEGKLFVALRGERFDGHAFVAQALAGGAAAALVDRDVDVPPAASLIRVASTLDALGALANAHRRRWGGQVVAVAGSAGKTTTRHAIGAVLRARLAGAVHELPGNLNNRIGVPMVLLAAEARHRAAVVEIGTNQRGEVEALTRVVQPDLAVLTLIALEHAEGIGDLDAVELEEGALLRGLPAGAAALCNGDDPRCRRQLERSPAAVRRTYGAGPDNDYRLCERVPLGIEGSRLCIERPRVAAGQLELRVPHLGLPGALATLAAIAAAEQIGGSAAPDLAAIERALAACEREAGRLLATLLGDGSVLIDDAYNANPASVESSLSVAREIATARGARLFLVLGDMLELGDHSDAAHRQTAEAVRAAAPAELIAVGPAATAFLDPVRQAGGRAEGRPQADAETAALLIERVRPGDVVLVKASRGIGADRLAKALLEAKGRAA